MDQGETLTYITRYTLATKYKLKHNLISLSGIRFYYDTLNNIE